MQNKPNFQKAKNVVRLVIKETCNNKQRTMNHQKQSQTKPKTRSEFTPKGAEIPTGELLGIHKPGTNQTQFCPPLCLAGLSASGRADGQ
jgi:hypothetical protein